MQGNIGCGCLTSHLAAGNLNTDIEELLRLPENFKSVDARAHALDLQRHILLDELVHKMLPSPVTQRSKVATL